MGATVDLDDQIHIFFEGVFRNVGSDCESGMLIDEVNTWSLRIDKQPVARNRDVSFDYKVGVLKIYCSLERLHDLDRPFSIIVGIGHNERNLGLPIIVNRQCISHIW